RLQRDAKDLRRQIKGYQEQVAEVRAGALAAPAQPAGELRIVAASLEGWDADGLKIIASHIVERPGFAAVLLSEPPPSAIVVARSKEVAVDSSAGLKSLVGRFG